MRKEEYSKFPQDLQMKFHEWFGENVPAALPFPAEADHSIRDTGPAVQPLPTDEEHLNLGTRRRVDNPQKLFWL
jgi:hypothetical protein